MEGKTQQSAFAAGVNLQIEHWRGGIRDFVGGVEALYGAKPFDHVPIRTVTRRLHYGDRRIESEFWKRAL